MNTRLQKFLAAENISQSQFADTLGVARASISHILAGRNRPGYDFLESLMQHYPALSIEWLMTGKGKMYKTATEPRLDFPEDLPDFQDDMPADEPRKPTQAAKKIKKLVLFYDDGTYEELYTEEII